MPRRSSTCSRTSPPKPTSERLPRPTVAQVPIVAVLAGPELEPRVPYVLATDVVRVPAGSRLPHRRGRAGARASARRAGHVARGAPAGAAGRCLPRADRELLPPGRADRRRGVVSGADMPAITIAQLRLVLRIAAAHGVEVDQERVPEVLAVVGGGFGFRALARRLLARLPLPGGAFAPGSRTPARVRSVKPPCACMRGALSPADSEAPRAVRSRS